MVSQPVFIVTRVADLIAKLVVGSVFAEFGVSPFELSKVLVEERAFGEAESLAT
jgi:hypothetical protein